MNTTKEGKRNRGKQLGNGREIVQQKAKEKESVLDQEDDTLITNTSKNENNNQKIDRKKIRSQYIDQETTTTNILQLLTMKTHFQPILEH